MKKPYNILKNVDWHKNINLTENFMKLYRRKKADRITYFEMSMKYKIEKLCNGEYWELKEFKNGKYVTLRYFKYFKNAKQYLAENI